MSNLRQISVFSGNIATDNADAIIMTLSSERLWFRKIDRDIRKDSGKIYYDQLLNERPDDLETSVSYGNKNERSYDIIFVADEYVSSLGKIMISGLETADKFAYKHISIPFLRSEVMLKEVEKNDEERVAEIVSGLAEYFEKREGSQIESVKFVIDNNERICSLLIIEIWKNKFLKSKLTNKMR